MNNHNRNSSEEMLEITEENEMIEPRIVQLDRSQLYQGLLSDKNAWYLSCEPQNTSKFLKQKLQKEGKRVFRKNCTDNWQGYAGEENVIIYIDKDTPLYKLPLQEWLGRKPFYGYVKNKWRLINPFFNVLIVSVTIPSERFLPSDPITLEEWENIDIFNLDREISDTYDPTYVRWILNYSEDDDNLLF